MTAGHPEPLPIRWARRLTCVVVLAASWVVVLASLAGLPLLALFDLLARRRLATCRGQLAFLAFLTAEVFGLALAGTLWLVSPFLSTDRFMALNRELQRRWAEGLFAALRRIYGLSLTVEGAELMEEPGTLVVLSRHVSTVDTLLPMLVLGRKRALRYVLKRELLWDPCLDVVGQRLPNVFVRRGSPDRGAELERLCALASDLGAGDAAVIFPEGTRFSPDKRRSVVNSLSRRGETVAVSRAQRLSRVLPPRLAGSHALLAARPTADVLLLAHAGLEGAYSLSSLWGESLIGREVRVRLWRTPAQEVPRAPEQLEEWLWDAWLGLDEWLSAQDGAARRVGATGS